MKELRNQHLVIMSSPSEKAEYKAQGEVEGFHTMSDWVRFVLKQRIKSWAKANNKQ